MSKHDADQPTVLDTITQARAAARELRETVQDAKQAARELREARVELDQARQQMADWLAGLVAGEAERLVIAAVKAEVDEAAREITKAQQQAKQQAVADVHAYLRGMVRENANIRVLVEHPKGKQGEVTGR
jgi:DNA repair ATPase RecN